MRERHKTLSKFDFHELWKRIATAACSLISEVKLLTFSYLSSMNLETCLENVFNYDQKDCY